MGGWTEKLILGTLGTSYFIFSIRTVVFTVTEVFEVDATSIVTLKLIITTWEQSGFNNEKHGDDEQSTNEIAGHSFTTSWFRLSGCLQWTKPTNSEIYMLRTVSRTLSNDCFSQIVQASVLVLESSHFTSSRNSLQLNYYRKQRGNALFSFRKLVFVMKEVDYTFLWRPRNELKG